MCNYFGILVLSVFCIGLVESQCNKEDAQKILDKMKDSRSSMSHVTLYQEMKIRDDDFGRTLFDCEDGTELLNAWDKLKNKLLNEIKKKCPDFEQSYGEIVSCRDKLDDYNFGIDHVKYCSVFKNCLERHETSCGPLKELTLLIDPMSNASVNFCTMKCDDIAKLRQFGSNCWAGAKNKEKLSPKRFEVFSDCLLDVISPSCRISKEIIFRIMPLFQFQSQDIISRSVSEKPDSQCIKEWKALQNTKDLTPDMCSMLEKRKECITKVLKENDTRLKELLAKCRYTVVNLIKTEALYQPTAIPTQSPSTASGKLGGGPYHFAVICWLVTMVTYHFNLII